MQRTDYVPETCVWELTLQCNMRCLHCGSNAGKKREHELSLQECLRLADDLHRLGCKHVTLIGGELFLYPGWEKIARRLDEHGILVNIITNSWLMSETQLAQIAYAGLTNVGISLDGLEARHDKIRGRSGSFRRILKAFDRLHQKDVAVGVVTTVMDLNLNDLAPMHDLLIEQGVASWQIQTARDMGRFKTNSAYALDQKKMGVITGFFKEKSFDARLIMVAGDDIGYYDENEKHLRHTPGHWGTWQGCQAGLSVIGIDSIGNVRGCQSLYDPSFIEGNVRQTPLAEIWQLKNGFAYNRQFDVSLLRGKCGECEMASKCRGGCRGSNYFSTGSAFHNVYCSRRID